MWKMIFNKLNNMTIEITLKILIVSLNAFLTQSVGNSIFINPYDLNVISIIKIHLKLLISKVLITQRKHCQSQL